jgi:hypothetical protein
MRLRQVPIERIAIAKPPVEWFYGIVGAIFDLYRQGLVDLGLAVFDVPVDAFLPPDATRISRLLSDLRAFKPQCALGFDGAHALICRLPARRDGFRPNLFTDVLDIPTICPWDHAPSQIADQLLKPHPADPAASTAVAWEALHRVLTHPRMVHWSCDSGQTKIMNDLGFLLPGHVIEDVPPVLPGFLPRDIPADCQGGCESSAGFVGHLYQEPANYPDPALAALAGEVIQTWTSAFGQPIWQVLAGQISRMPDGMRRRLALDRDQTYFWSFAYELIIRQAQTSFRLKMLNSANVPVVCYGNLQTDLPGVSTNLFPAPSMRFGPELAAAFARHPITIDALNPGFVNGYSEKHLHAFSSGGFMLMNRKQDFVDAFGEAGEEVSYVDAGDLASKVDRFLGNPRYRREVGDAIRERIDVRFELKEVLRRLLQFAYQCAETAGSNSNSTKPSQNDRHVTTVRDLLPQMRSLSDWEGASVQHEESGVRVSTEPQAWRYAAAIRIPPVVSTLHEPHLRVRLRVDAGRIGLAALRDSTETLIAEQCVSPSAGAVTVTVELPREGVSDVILRNTVETASRALVLEASLCDYTAGESVPPRQSDDPYLSVVVTARNDDHGGNLLGRMQVFVDAWIHQARRYGLDCELILVEWNPPAERPRLRDALRWPEDPGPCRVRILDVPAEVHSRYRHAAALPLYQMIAKNAGIRRARGEFILATNIDVVFSGELVAFLAERKLEKGRLYRVDPTDVMADVPVDGTLDEQLEYCRSYALRLAGGEDPCAAAAGGFRLNQARDITTPGSGIRFGRGWYGVDRYFGDECFRWIDEDAHILLEAPGTGVLELEVEAGPGLDLEKPWHQLRAADENGGVLAEWRIEGRTRIELVVPATATRGRVIRLLSEGGGFPVLDDPCLLNFRVMRCDWRGPQAESAAAATLPGLLLRHRPLLGRLLGSNGLAGFSRTAPAAARLLGSLGDDIFAAGMDFRIGAGVEPLETGESEKFRWMARSAGMTVQVPRGGGGLALLVEPGPAVGFQPFDLVVRLRGGKTLTRVRVPALAYVELPLTLPPLAMLMLELTAEGGGQPVGKDPRTLACRLFAVGEGTGSATEPAGITDPPGPWPSAVTGSQPPQVNWRAKLEPGLQLIAAMGRPPLVHTAACGDFTLMAREHWWDVRGHAELDQFSMHLDSLLCYAAYHARVRETLLPESMRAYHIEYGSGWPSERYQEMYARTSRNGIPDVAYEDLLELIAAMRFLHAPVIFNGPSWGLAQDELCESAPGAAGA